MSYKLYSFHTSAQHNSIQWAERTVKGELESCQTRTIKKIFDKYITHPESKIVEAGCGLGGWVNYFYLKKYDVIGLEIDDDLVDKVKKYDSKIPVEKGDIFNINYPDAHFDVYISLGVIEHFEEGPLAALQEANRVLKNGGLVFITVPYLNIFRRLFVHPLRNLFFLVYKMIKKKCYFWEYRFTKNEMAKFLEQSGFEIISTGIDDYLQSDKSHHIGLYADFFFLRKRKGEIWELNFLGKIILWLSRASSPWLVCSGVHLVAKKKN